MKVIIQSTQEAVLPYCLILDMILKEIFQMDLHNEHSFSHTNKHTCLRQHTQHTLLTVKISCMLTKKKRLQRMKTNPLPSKLEFYVRMD